jgi:sugar O-acyltransferase (sialic acid O-acetyltransferase NeuD family)
MKDIVIFGNTMIAKLAHYYFSRDKEYKVVAFTVDSKYINSSHFLDLPLLPFENIETVYPPEKYLMFVAIGPNGMNSLRERKFHDAKAKGYRLASHVSSKSVCESQVGENCFVADCAVINPFVEMGNNNFFWEQCYISCDAVIENNCYFSPHSTIGTFCHVGSNCIIGTSASIKTRIKLSYKSLIGSSSFISKDTEALGVYGEKSSALYGCISDKIDITV